MHNQCLQGQGGLNQGMHMLRTAPKIHLRVLIASTELVMHPNWALKLVVRANTIVKLTHFGNFYKIKLPHTSVELPRESNHIQMAQSY